MNTLFDHLDAKPPQPAPPINLPTNGTPTSRAAAEAKAKSGTADTDRARIAAWLYEHPAGATRDELADALGIDSNSARPRCWELLGRDPRYLERGGEPVLIEVGTREWGGHGPAKVLVHLEHANRSNP